jgi:multisubunit Na+/H+ antiporter MnhE subunit
MMIYSLFSRFERFDFDSNCVSPTILKAIAIISVFLREMMRSSITSAIVVTRENKILNQESVKISLVFYEGVEIYPNYSEQ